MRGAFDSLGDLAANVFNQFVDVRTLNPLGKSLRCARSLTTPQKPFVKTRGGNNVQLLALRHGRDGSGLTTIIRRGGVVDGIASRLAEVA